MNNGEVCRECQNYGFCSPELTPISAIEDTVEAAVNCRHYTCPMGRLQAERMIKHVARKSRGKITWPVEFGSTHKPMGTRRVEEDGQICSKQDGEWYPTGQVLDVATILACLEVT